MYPLRLKTCQYYKTRDSEVQGSSFKDKAQERGFSDYFNHLRTYWKQNNVCGLYSLNKFHYFITIMINTKHVYSEKVITIKIVKLIFQAH